MYKVANNKVAEIFSGAKTVGKVAQSLRHLDKVIEMANTSMNETVVMCEGNSLAYVTGINGFDVPVDEDAALVLYKDFRKSLELARATDPEQIAVIHTDDGDFYVTNVTIEVYNLEENYPDGQLGCRVMLY